ncbi:hypothetical protein F4779DRAFT_633454 [Xylariaceae sp. FL0662B]|nr:hypothetical protein F4779DRAFT_633454 [Xylariaceae sp. FL0662B]
MSSWQSISRATAELFDIAGFEQPVCVWPEADANGYMDLVPFGYTSAQLNAHSKAIRDAANNLGQLAIQWRFVLEYLSYPDLMSFEEADEFLQDSLRALDQYFFCSSLTQDNFKERIVSVRFVETFPYSRRDLVGDTVVALNWSVFVPKQTIIIAWKHRGIVRSKLALFETLAHELTHAFLESFFNRSYEERDILVGPDNDGHGWLFNQVNMDVMHTIQEWDMKLGGLAVEPDKYSIAERFEDRYLEIMARCPRFRAQWEHDDSRSVLPRNLRWPIRDAALTRALLRLRYPDYMDFVQARTYRAGMVFVAVEILLAVCIVAAVDIVTSVQNGWIWVFLEPVFLEPVTFGQLVRFVKLLVVVIFTEPCDPCDPLPLGIPSVFDLCDEGAMSDWDSNSDSADSSSRASRSSAFSSSASSSSASSSSHPPSPRLPTLPLLFLLALTWAWTVFLRHPIRLALWFSGWALRELAPDAGDIVLSAEL